jgi:predicted enzyme related to lactoylglutathione lyase
MANAKYAHTNIVSEDWEKLSKFYELVFECRPVPPERAQAGKWLEKGTGVKNASLKGVHLRLPGHGDSGPTLEIYEYAEALESNSPAANRKGICHLAFEVSDVESTLDLVVKNGGSPIGEISENFIEGVGTIQFVYAADPEGNVLEIQRWN